MYTSFLRNAIRKDPSFSLLFYSKPTYRRYMIDVIFLGMFVLSIFEKKSVHLTILWFWEKILLFHFFRRIQWNVINDSFGPNLVLKTCGRNENNESGGGLWAWKTKNSAEIVPRKNSEQNTFAGMLIISHRNLRCFERRSGAKRPLAA